ncbi:OprO/OprP family phosphate-selective porin [Tundrisphaera lichenicola]|uniref:OprO/OprP family phosphate-selective porin n=1 Tax=Tundrisphaera lichenicola TaxID=2029860 RepID=UPI003EBECAD6
MLAEELARTRKEQEARLQEVLDRVENLPKRSSSLVDGMAIPEAIEAAPGADVPAANAENAASTPVPDYTEGQFFPNTPAPGFPVTKSAGRGGLPLSGRFGPGFQFMTEDEKFRLQIHYESQIEGRVWGQSDQVPANSGIFLPRQRIFFNGNITKPIEYELAINRGFGTINVLNAYINLHFDDRFELRFGRFFTPFNYDQYAISNYWLPTPERSIYTTNVGLNRQFGLMAWGYLFDKRLDYAAGIFNGSRNSFESLSNGVDFVGYLNVRPFQESETYRLLRFLNLGTSFSVGHQDQSPVPVSFRIAGGSPNADNPGPGTVPFLILDRGVIERGQRLLGSVHSAYFYKSLSLIGEWQYGYGNYASPAHPRSAQVPFSGFYVSGGYFLTGEEVERRSRVVPLRPLVPTSKLDRRGLGAWELAGRVSKLSLGREIFDSGFADPNLWSNQAITTELGVNWYWNEYVKMYMFWLHGDFGSPVQYRPGGFQTTADLFWLRFQLYF